MLRNYRVAYSNKNFYKDLGLSQHFTLAGFLRRIRRRHPTATKILTFSAVYICVSASSLALIPGTVLPMQRAFKNYLLDKLNEFNRFRYMNSFNPNPGLFIQRKFSSILYGIEHNVLSATSLAECLCQVNAILLDEKWKQQISNRSRVEVVLNSILLMDKLISGVGMKDYLRDPQIYEQYVRIADNANLVKVVNSPAATKNNSYEDEEEQNTQINAGVTRKLQQDLKPSLLVTFKIYDYLLKYRRENITEILQRLHSFLTITQASTKHNIKSGSSQQQEDFGFIVRSFVKNEELKRQIKQIYLNQPHCRSIIQLILKQVDGAMKKDKIV